MNQLPETIQLYQLFSQTVYTSVHLIQKLAQGRQHTDPHNDD